MRVVSADRTCWLVYSFLSLYLALWLNKYCDHTVFKFPLFLVFVLFCLLTKLFADSLFVFLYAHRIKQLKLITLQIEKKDNSSYSSHTQTFSSNFAFFANFPHQHHLSTQCGLLFFVSHFCFLFPLLFFSFWSLVSLIVWINLLKFAEKKETEHFQKKIIIIINSNNTRSRQRWMVDGRQWEGSGESPPRKDNKAGAPVQLSEWKTPMTVRVGVDRR